jgi:hypothetical protein
MAKEPAGGWEVATIGNVLVMMKQHHADATVQGGGCNALRNLAAANQANAQAIAASGGVEVVLAAMRQHPADAAVQKYGCYALKWLAHNNPKLGIQVDHSPTPTCSRKHGLVEFTTTQIGFHCDVCDRRQPSGAVMFGCRRCDYDMCLSCRHATSVSQPRSLLLQTPPYGLDCPPYSLVSPRPKGQQCNTQHSRFFLEPSFRSECPPPPPVAMW